MSLFAKAGRILVPLFSLSLLAGYVVYSHFTPNTPPPDPLGLNTVELTLEPEIAEFDGFINHGSPVPAKERPTDDLRIISSKVINQPIFTVRKREPDAPEFRTTTADFKARGFEMVKKLELSPGVSSDAPPPAGSFLKRPIEPLEQPEIIKRILADDGHSLDESRKIFAPEKIAEAILYEKDAAHVGSRIFKPLEDPVAPLYWPLVRLLMPQPLQRSLIQNTP